MDGWMDGWNRPCTDPRMVRYEHEKKNLLKLLDEAFPHNFSDFFSRFFLTSSTLIGYHLQSKQALLHVTTILKDAVIQGYTEMKTEPLARDLVICIHTVL